MTVVVADSSPLNYLTLIGSVDVQLLEMNFRVSMSLVDELLAEDADRRRRLRL